MIDSILPSVTETVRFSFGEERAAPPVSTPETKESDTSQSLRAFFFDSRYSMVDPMVNRAQSSVSLHWDKELQRHVVIKTFFGSKDSEERERFLKECRISACLEHPSIIPVYDILNVPGKIRLAMRKVSGKPVTESLKAEFPNPASAVQKFNRITQIFIEICRVLEFVHKKGHVHRDIKPDNLLIGEYGEVFLIDWGSSPDGQGAVWATPSHMSPEQACGEQGDLRTDIYSLGVMLFECLLGRLPIPSTNSNEIFERRKRGEIVMPTREELTQIPEPLFSICLKAMSKEPNMRYASAADFATDLSNYQSGLAVSAQPDSFAAFTARWFRRYRSRILKILLVAIPFLVLSGILYQTLLRDIAKWGGAIVKESFDDPGWKSRWDMLTRPDWISQNGGITFPSRALGWEAIFLNQMFSAPLAVEFDCRIAPSLPGEPPPSDVCLIWAENGAVDGVQDNFTLMQFGAYSNELALIAQNSKSFKSSSVGTSIIDFAPYRLTPGTDHHFRIEIEGSFITMFANGKKVLQSELLVPPQSGWIGFWAGGGLGNKIFDNVAVYSRGAAERLPGTVLGDYHLKSGHLDEAVAEFARIHASHTSSPFGQEAAFKQGLALWRQGKEAEARAVWEHLESPHYRLEAQILWLGRLFQNRDFDRFIPEFQRTAQEFPLSTSKSLQLFWASCAKDFGGSLLLTDDARRFLALTDNEKNRSLALDLGRYGILLALEDFETIHKELGNKNGVSLIYLQKMGLFDEVLARPAQTLSCFSAKKNALIFREDFDAARNLPNPSPQWLVEICLNEKGIDETITRYPQELLSRRYYLLQSGKFQELLDEQPDDPQSVFLALLSLNRPEEVIARDNFTTELKLLARYFQLFRRYTQGDSQALPEYLEIKRDIDTRVLAHSDIWFENVIVPAVLLAHAGRPDEGMEIIRAYGSDPHHQFQGSQIPWAFTRLMAGLCTEEEFDAQPVKSRNPSRKILALALRDDIEGRRSAARAGYEAFQAIPFHKKDNTVFIQRFVEWRLQDLSTPP